MAEFQVADVRSPGSSVALHRLRKLHDFKPAPHHEKSANAMLDQVIAWGGALKTLREKRK